MAAGGQHQPIGAHQQALTTARPPGTAPAHLQGKPTSGRHGRPLQARPREQLHTGLQGRAAQGGRHGFGTVGPGEQAAIGLLHQLEAMLVEPGHRIAAGKTGEGPPQGLAPAGIVTHQRPGIPAGVGDIAAAAATDQDLVQGLAGGLEQHDVAHAGLSGGNGGHETGGPATRHHHGSMTRQHQQGISGGAWAGSMG